mgnify:CR=1 FL=1
MSVAFLHHFMRYFFYNLSIYFDVFYNFCFELKIDNMLKGQINFNYLIFVDAIKQLNHNKIKTKKNKAFRMALDFRVFKLRLFT